MVTAGRSVPLVYPRPLCVPAVYDRGGEGEESQWEGLKGVIQTARRRQWLTIECSLTGSPNLLPSFPHSLSRGEMMLHT